MTEDATTILLFSYGTLQQENVQLSSFGPRARWNAGCDAGLPELHDRDQPTPR